MASSTLEAETARAGAGGRSSLIPAQVSGVPLQRANGERIGTIERLMIDQASGRVAFAVVSLGQGAGSQPEYATLPWNALTYNQGLNVQETSLTADQLTGVPRRSSPGGEDPSADREWNEHVHQYFNREAFSDEAVQKATHEAQ